MSNFIHEYEYFLVFESGYPMHISDNFNAKLAEKMTERWTPIGQHQMNRIGDLISISQMTRRHSDAYISWMKEQGYELPTTVR